MSEIDQRSIDQDNLSADLDINPDFAAQDDEVPHQPPSFDSGREHERCDNIQLPPAV